MTFNEARIAQIERAIGRKLTDEERAAFLAGITLDVR
jgi:hypothetical protein